MPKIQRDEGLRIGVFVPLITFHKSVATPFVKVRDVHHDPGFLQDHDRHSS